MTTLLLILKGHEGMGEKKFKHQKSSTSPVPNFLEKFGTIFFNFFLNFNRCDILNFNILDMYEYMNVILIKMGAMKIYSEFY